MAVYEVTIKGQILGQTHENVVHFAKDAPVTNEPQLLANSIRDVWLAQVKTFTPSDLIWTTITVRDTGAPLLAAFNLSINIQGTSSGLGGMPPFVCFLIKFQTAQSGRQGRGRYYQSGPNNGHVVNGRLTTAVIDFINPKLAALFAAYSQTGTAGYALVVCPRSNPGNFKTVTSITLDTLPRVQRRRNIGVGV